MKGGGNSTTKDKGQEDEESVNGDVMLPITADRMTVTDEDEQLDADKKHRRCLTERKRKDKIKIGIQKIGQLLPLSYRSEKESATFLLEQAAVYIKDLQQQVDRLLLEDGDQVKADEIRRLREANDGLRQDITSMKEILQTGALQNFEWTKSRESLSSMDNAVDRSPSSVGDLTSPTGSTASLKRRNLVSQQLKESPKTSEESQLTLNGAPAISSVLLSPDATISSTTCGNTSFMNQMFLSPQSGALNCSASGLLEESTSVHDKTSDGIVDADTLQTMAASLTSTTQRATSPQPRNSNVIAASQPPQPALTVSTNSTINPQVLGPQLNNMPAPAGPASASGSGQLQGTLVLHNGQLLLVNPQLQANATGQGLLKTVNPQDKVPKSFVGASVSLSGAHGQLMAPSSGAPLNTLLSTPQMMPHGANPAMAMPGANMSMPHPTSLMPSRPAVNVNMPPIRTAMGQTLMQNCVQDPSAVLASQQQQGVTGLTAPGMLSQPTVNMQPQPGALQMPTPAAPPSSLPSALLLPNGQIVPVVTQPNMMVPGNNTQQPMAGPAFMPPANSSVRLPIVGPQQVINNQGVQLPGVNAQNLRMNASSVISTNAMQTPLLSAGTVRLCAPGTNTVHHVPSSTGVQMSQPLPVNPGNMTVAPRPSAPTNVHMGGVGQPHPSSVINSQLTLPNPAVGVGTGPSTTTLVSGAASGQTGATPSSTSGSVPPLSAQNLPTTVAAVLTPEGNIILTFGQAGSGSGASCQTTQGKKTGPRALMPKPLNVSRTSTPVESAVASKASNVEETTDKSGQNQETAVSVPSTTSSTTAQLSIAITTCTTSSGLPSSTDILAKAAESIFASGSPSDMSPSMPGFYNPAHDDNPLHIDTGGDGDASKVAGGHPVQIPGDGQSKGKKSKGTTKAGAKTKAPKASKKKKVESSTTENPPDNFNAQMSVESLGFSSVNNPEETGFMDHIPTTCDKIDQEEESDINDFSDLIKLHEPPILSSTDTITKPPSPVDTQKQQFEIPVCSADFSGLPASSDSAQPPVPQSSAPCSTTTTVLTTVHDLPQPIAPSLSSSQPLLSMPQFSLNGDLLPAVPMSVATDTGSAPSSLPSSTTSTFVLPPALQSSYIALPPAVQKEKHKKHKHKKKDRSDGSKSKKKHKEEKEKKRSHSEETPEGPPVLDQQALSMPADLQPQDFPPDLSKDPPLRTSTPPPQICAPYPEGHKASKPKKSKSKSKSKKKKHRDNEANSSMVSSTECESTLTTSALDSSTDSQKEQVLMEIQNDLVAQVSEPNNSSLDQSADQTSVSKDAVRLFWEKEDAQRKLSSGVYMDKMNITGVDLNLSLVEQPSPKKHRKSSKPKKKSDPVNNTVTAANLPPQNTTVLAQSEPVIITPVSYPDTTPKQSDKSVLLDPQIPSDITDQTVENRENIEACGVPGNEPNHNLQQPQDSTNKKKNKMRPEDVIPEQITFSENDLAAVLNQVESYGETLGHDNVKKSKGKRKCSEEHGPAKKKKSKGAADGDKTNLLQSMEYENRIKNEPPPPSLATTKLCDEKHAGSMDVFAFTEEDDADLSSPAKSKTLAKSRKKSGKARKTDVGSEQSKGAQEKADAKVKSPQLAFNHVKTKANSLSPQHQKSKLTVVTDTLSSAVPQSKTSSPARTELPISSPPLLIADCAQPAAASPPSQISPPKNLIELPNLMTPCAPNLEDADRIHHRESVIMDDYDMTTPNKNSSSTDMAMNEAIDSLCRILPSPGKEKDPDTDKAKSTVLSLDLDEPPPTPARHDAIVNLAQVTTAVPTRKALSANEKSKAKVATKSQPPVPLPPLPEQQNLSETDPSEAGTNRPGSTKELVTQKDATSKTVIQSSSAKPEKSPEKTPHSGTTSKSAPKEVSNSKEKSSKESQPNPVVPQKYPCDRGSGYAPSLHHSPINKTAQDKSPRSSEQRKTTRPVADRPPTAGSSASLASLSHTTPLQHENFSSCMAQSSHNLRHEKEVYSPPPISSAGSCAIQAGKSPAEAYSFSPQYPPMPGTNLPGPPPPNMPHYSHPVTSGSNTFSYTLSPNQTVTTTSTGVMSAYDQPLQSSGYMYPDPGTAGLGPPQPLTTPSQAAPQQHMPPALGFPPLDTSSGSKSGGSCGAPASASGSSSNIALQRETTQPGSATEKRAQSNSRSSQQTSPYGNFMPNSSQHQQHKSYSDTQHTPSNLSRNQKDSSSYNSAGSGRQSSSSASSASNNRTSTGSVGRSPQMTQSKETPTQFLSPTGGAYQVTGIGSSNNPLTSPPLHHHGPAPSSHRSASSSQRSSYSGSQYSANTSSFGPISGFGAQAFDPPTAQFGGMNADRENRAGSGTAGYGGSSSSNQNTQKLGSSSKSVSNVSTSKSGSTHHQHKSSSSSRSSKRSKSSKQSSATTSTTSIANPYEMDPSLFDPNRMTPYFPLAGLSPPPRTLQADGPTYIPNLFNNPGRAGHLSHNSNSLQHKDPSMGHHFMFGHHSRGPQNGIGLNFAHTGFGMNPMHHTNHVSSSQLTPHTNSVSVTPHMPNFNLTNIFSDMNNPAAQPGADGLNISPIKFPGGNGLLGPQAGMDPNLQHAHQGAMYHNPRGPQMPPPPMLHNTMNINSLLSHQHPGFEAAARGVAPSISGSMAAPFGGHGHAPSFGMHPLNFPMHDH